MQTDAIFAIIFRYGMIILYLYLFDYFYRGYQASKKAGFPNQFFLGFVFLFAILVIFHVVYGTYELYQQLVPNYVNLQAQFPWYQPQGNAIDIVAAQVRPIFLFFYFLMNCVIATQVYPLEKAIGWKTTPVTKIMIVFGCSLWLLFIPALSYTYFSYVPITLGFVGIFLGFVINIGANIKIFKDSTGALRRQAVYAILAFLFLGVGLLWAFEVNFGPSINPAITNNDDVVIGCCIQLASAVFYRRGFQVLAAGESNSVAQVKSPVWQVVTGHFSSRGLQAYLIIVTGVFVLFVALAWITYPAANHFSIMTDTFSFLGSSNPDHNPPGWFNFSIAFVATGILLLPLTFYRNRAMKQVSRAGAALSALFYLATSIGIAGIGIFPDTSGGSFFGDLNSGQIHNEMALIAFVGFGVALLLDFFWLVKDRIPHLRGQQVVPLRRWVAPYLIFFTVVVLDASTQLYWSATCTSNCWPGPFPFSFPFWEWVTIIMIFVVLFWMLLVLPPPTQAE
ncbi:MAG TPA: DUF998 domain-containing protein [Candidatus Lokiarchaeia archaeon]|nr:DUF998 domain-containing protein [Candidatus Lokiarchaeia archaeon]